MGGFLAIDTVSARPSIAAVSDKGAFAQDLPSGRRQSAELLSHVEVILDKAKLGFPDLTQLAVLTGPGSFTGIRIGLSFFKGLSLALDIPLYGIDHFTLLAGELPKEGKGALLLESGRDEKFVHFAEKGGLIGSALNTGTDMICDIDYYISDFAPDLRGSPKHIQVRKTTAETLYDFLKEKNLHEREKRPIPYYIREADTTPPKLQA